MIACIGLGLGVGAIVTLRAVDKPPALIGTMQLAQINLVGTWRDKGEATIVFSSPGDPPQSEPGGQFSFSRMPSIFNWRSADATPSSAVGLWTIGTFAGSPDGVVFTIEGSELHNQQPIQVVLLAQGDPSAPQLVCQYPDGPDACTFTKTTP